MRVLIVDDEPLARRGLQVLLGSIPEIQIVGEAGNVAQALALVSSARPDLILLDIELREENGFELLTRLDRGESPAIVFVTAYSQHAIRAFEESALDYLLKPVAPDRLAAAIDRVRNNIALRKAAGKASQIERVAFWVDGAARLVSLSEIETVESAGNYCCVQVKGGQLIIRETLTAVAARLDPSRFVRIHKSMILSFACVKEIQPLPNRDATAVLKSGRKVRVSRQYRDRLDMLTGSPLG